MDKLSMKVSFEQARELYPGRKRGLDAEWDYFYGLTRFKHRRGEVVSLMLPAIQRQIEHRKNATGFIPAWKDFKSWVYNSYWTLEYGSRDKNAPVMCRNCGRASVGRYGNIPHCHKIECRHAAGDTSYRERAVL